MEDPQDLSWIWNSPLASWQLSPKVDRPQSLGLGWVGSASMRRGTNRSASSSHDASIRWLRHYGCAALGWVLASPKTKTTGSAEKNWMTGPGKMVPREVGRGERGVIGFPYRTCPCPLAAPIHRAPRSRCLDGSRVRVRGRGAHLHPHYPVGDVLYLQGTLPDFSFKNFPKHRICPFDFFIFNSVELDTQREFCTLFLPRFWGSSTFLLNRGDGAHVSIII